MWVLVTIFHYSQQRTDIVEMHVRQCAHQPLLEHCLPCMHINFNFGITALPFFIHSAPFGAFWTLFGPFWALWSYFGVGSGPKTFFGPTYIA